ncbi:S8 family serine peptidase [Kribbella deserti]|uniref:S8 family serine peptidase n=1 Tax=Kribbella deserti TaxID=1926257 RepID=A0ABV6QFE2_9ACTN
MRTRLRRLGQGALAFATVAAALTGLTGTAASSAQPDAVRPADQGATRGAGQDAPRGGGPGVVGASRLDQTITLISGDRVALRGAKTPVAQAGPGRAGMGFHISKVGGDTFVLPYDAAALVAAGRVDRRLFNVTKLAEFGYDDRSRADIPLIVAGGTEKVRALQADGKARELKSAGAVALRKPKVEAAAFWKLVRGDGKSALAAGVNKVWLDGKVRATLDQSVPQIGAPAAWQGGHTGAGTKVAVLDTGIDTTHADLSDAVVQQQDFTGSEYGADDRSGHGTHVASTITGRGGSHQGVAPGTELLNGKVLGDDGSGSESAVLAGMEWAVAHGADVVNMSLSSSDPGNGSTPLEQAVDRLTAETGALFVVAAGNEGPGSQTIGSPASADSALAVGAVDRSDQLAPFSSRGPRRGDGAIKPDLTAPGVGIVAARAQHATIGDPVGTGYSRLSGTSMAAPHVAGAAAILAGQHPDWTPGQLKAALMGSAEPTPGLTVYQQGAGRVDVARATRQQVHPEAGSLDLGTALWPHHDDQPVTRTVTYRNDGDEPITLTLSTDVQGPLGVPAPAGMFTISARTLIVPAHGSASTELTAKPAIDGPDGNYKGAVVATAGTTRVRTIIALHREVESYDVTVKTVDWNGRPSRPDYFLIVNVERPGFSLLNYPEDTAVVRLPAGRYYYDSFLYRINSEAPFSYSAAYFIEPEIVVSSNQTLSLDARDAVPIGFRTEHREAALGGHEIASWRDTPYAGDDSVGFVAGGTELFPILEDIRIRPSRTSAPGRYHFDLAGLLARLDGKGGYTGSPYQYHLKWSEDGKVPATLNRRFSDGDLAELRTRIAAQVPGGVAEKDWIAATATPGTIVERYSPGFEFWPANVTQWSDKENDAVVSSQVAIAPRVFANAGPVGIERWNVGPFVPRQDPDNCSCRAGDELTVSLKPYSGQNLDHVGDSTATSEGARLLRDGVEVASSSSAGFLAAEVPAGQATYRLETKAARTNSPFTSRQSAAWTFRSGTTTEATPLPLMIMRFAPKLDDLNQAPAGGPYAVPVTIHVQNGAARGTLTSLKVDASYDGGVTWRPAKMVGQTALVEHPRQAAFVSLRATAADSSGNKAELTVISAYRLR